MQCHATGLLAVHATSSTVIEGRKDSFSGFHSGEWQVRAERDEYMREVERMKVQAMAAMDRRKAVEEELLNAKEELILLQWAVEKDRTALKAIRETAESRDHKTGQLEVSAGSVFGQRAARACGDGCFVLLLHGPW